MIFYRLLDRKPRPSSMAGVDRALTQYRWYRVLCGGLYVKIDGRWHGAVALLTLADGTQVLRCEGNTASFHETHNSIQQLEDHT